MTESKLLMKEKEVIVPGDILAEGMDYLPSNGTYRKGENIYANQTGLLIVEGKVLKTIPLAGVYMPKRNDVIIGKVIDILMSGWRIDTNSPYSSVLMLKDATFDYIKKGADLTAFFDLDEYLVCRIVQVTSQNLIDVSMKGPGMQKLKGGRIVKVNAMKVPRIVGKRASMVNMVKFATGCTIVAGQNGLVWFKGEPEQEVLAIETIRKIEREAHVAGLTERIKKFLEKATGKTIGDKNFAEEEQERRPYNDRPRDDRGSRDGPRRDGPRPERSGSRPPQRGPRRTFQRR